MKKLLITVSLISGISLYSQQIETPQTIIISPINSIALEETANRPTCWSYLEMSDDLCCHAWSVMCSNGYGWSGEMMCNFGCQLAVGLGNAWNRTIQPNGGESIDYKKPKIASFEFKPFMIQKDISDKNPLDVILEYKQISKHLLFKLETPSTLIIGNYTYVYQAGIYEINNNKMTVSYYYK